MPASKVTLRVPANGVLHRLSPLMIGANLEDLNYQCYGGLYSQLLHGEHFQEPSSGFTRPLKGFRAYGGTWNVRDGVLFAAAEAGAMLVADGPVIADGAAGAEVFFRDEQEGRAGLIVRVIDPSADPRSFEGYSIHLCPKGRKLMVVRHKPRTDWVLIDTVCDFAVKQWVHLEARFAAKQFEVLVNGIPFIAADDSWRRELSGGPVGLRADNSDAQFRNLWVAAEGGKKQPIALDAAASAGTRDDISLRWAKVQTGTAQGSFGLEHDHPLAGKQSQRVTFESGRGEIGIDNAGLHRWGLNLLAGREYEGSVCLQSLKAAAVTVSLRSAGGRKIYASRTLKVKGSRRWQSLSFKLKPSRTDRDARFAITLSKPASIVVGYAFLQPGQWGRFAGLHVRKDLAEAVIAQGIKIIRYNGSMVTCPNQSDYQWKKMIGPRENRPPYVGTFNPFASHGWGIPDFLAFCQAAGIVAVPGVNRSESPADLADLVEYCNGPAGSKWGRRRAADGFKKPLHLSYIQYGNEERINDEYLADFKAAAAAVWAKDPTITMVVSDWMYWDGIPDPQKIARATCENLDAHVKLLQWARDEGGKVWWDVHVWEAGPWVSGVKGIADLHAWFEKFVPYYPVPIAALEQNAGNHDLKRGLAHACMSNELAKLGRFVPAAAAPNTMQPWQQYTTRGWDQGQIFFTQSKFWYQPSGYVDIMLTQNACPDLLEISSTLEPKEFSVTARKSTDGRTISIVAVNESDQPRPATIELDAFTPRKKTATVLELAGKPEHDNTPKAPTRVVPVKRTWRYAVRKGVVSYLFPPHSFTILRFE
ncbi:MAG: DUF1080 domain-containing protein [Planctomycetaceae bacterium]|nr:DUF1080 domain-containing protein [Planctomycetaceae bacterium]